MLVRIRLMGGPMHTKLAWTESLDQCKVFFDEGNRQVLLYVIEPDRTEYLFSPLHSAGLTEKYDACFAKFGSNAPSVVFEPPAPEPKDAECTPESYRRPEDGEDFLPPSGEFDPEGPSQSGDPS